MNKPLDIMYHSPIGIPDDDPQFAVMAAAHKLSGGSVISNTVPDEGEAFGNRIIVPADPAAALAA